MSKNLTLLDQFYEDKLSLNSFLNIIDCAH